MRCQLLLWQLSLCLFKLRADTDNRIRCKGTGLCRHWCSFNLFYHASNAYIRSALFSRRWNVLVLYVGAHVIPFHQQLGEPTATKLERCSAQAMSLERLTNEGRIPHKDQNSPTHQRTHPPTARAPTHPPTRV